MIVSDPGTKHGDDWRDVLGSGIDVLVGTEILRTEALVDKGGGWAAAPLGELELPNESTV